MSVTSYTRAKIDELLLALSTTLSGKADSAALIDGLAGKVNSSTFTTGLAAKADAAATATALASKADAAATSSALAGKASTASLATVATTGAYADLVGKPTIPPAFTAEEAQDAAAALLTAGTHTGISFSYDDAAGSLAAAVNTGGSALTLSATQTAPYVAKVGEIAMMNVPSGATTLTLPSNPANRAQVGFRSLGATTAVPLTIVRGGTDTIGDGGATSVVEPLSGVTRVYQFDSPSKRWLPVSDVKPLTALDGRFGDAAVAGLVGAPATATGVALRAAFVPRDEYVPGTGGSGASVGSAALGILSAGLGSAALGPCALVFCGDSVTEGYSATAPARYWVAALTARLQKAHPSGLGSESAMSTSQSATFTRNTVAGVHGYNAGQASTIASTYIGPGEAEKVAAVQPTAIFHAVGTNDYRGNRNPATYKAEILAQLDALDALLAAPTVHVLVHHGQPAHSSTPTYPWSTYGTALAEIATARPARVVYLDLAPAWSAAVPTFADALDLYNADNYHPNDRGHAFIADLTYRALEAPVGGVAVPIAAAPTTPALTNSAAPAITGTPTTGQTLTVSNGTWSATPDSYTYQWRRAGSAISGAAASTYVLQVADEGQAVTCSVTAIKATYTSGTATSNAVTPAAAGTPALTNSTPPTITGTPTEGQTLTASNGTWSATPDSFSYQWKRGGTNISAATASTYLLAPADVGATITVEVTAIKAGHSNGTATSAATAAVAAAPAGATITETFTGTDGATPTGWTTNATSFTYQAGMGRLDPASFGSGALMSGAASFTGDFDMTGTLKMTGNTANTAATIGVGSALAAGSNRPANGYTVDVILTSAGAVNSTALYRGTNFRASGGSVAASASGHKVRLQRIGAVLNVKVWPAGTAEPGAWQFTHTDPSPLSGVAYRPFVGCADQTGASGTTLADFDDLSVTYS